MDEFKIIDIAGNKERQFTPESFRTTGFLEVSGLILITGITESNLNDAIPLAESARKSGVITLGTPAGNDDIWRIAEALLIRRFEFGGYAN